MSRRTLTSSLRLLKDLDLAVCYTEAFSRKAQPAAPKNCWFDALAADSVLVFFAKCSSASGGLVESSSACALNGQIALFALRREVETLSPKPRAIRPDFACGESNLVLNPARARVHEVQRFG